MSTSSATDGLLAALRSRGFNPKQSGKGWTCCCPAHEDRNPSLSISVGDDGRALVKCHAGCETADVVAAVGLKMRDLMPEDDHPKPSRTPGRAGGGTASLVPETPADAPAKRGFGDGDSGDNSKTYYPTANAAVAELERQRGPRSALWTYHDVAGEPVGVVVRWDFEDGSKQTRPASRNGSGPNANWTLLGMPNPCPLYGLPELAASSEGDPVYVAEGEKAADAVRACSLIATTSPHGSKSAGKADWSPLAGRDVVILPDLDDAGKKYAEDVLSLAARAGARSVRVVRLWDRWDALPKGGDAADVLELEGGDADAVRTGIEALAAEAEPTELGAEDPPARFTPFPLDALPEPVRGYVIEAARAIGCDPCYVALPMLAGLAAAIGNTHWIELKRAWTEPPILWCATVGESGTAKSPAMEAALRPVKERQRRAMKEHERAVKEWEAEFARWEVEHAAWKKSAAKGDAGEPPMSPEKPVCQRTWTDDTTTEALVVRLQENPRGLLMIRDELAGWFSFDRYAGGKGGGDAARWLEVFGGRALIVDRKGSGTEYVPRASVSIAGGIQPEVLRRSLGQKNRDNGLAARLLFAMPPRQPKRWTEDDVSEQTEAALAAVFDRLYALESDTDPEGDPRPRLIRMDADAKRVCVRFVNEHGAQQAKRIGDEAAAWSKLEGYAARFALVLHLARVAADDPTITDAALVDEASITAGVVLVRWFAHEVERVYALLSGDEEAREQTHLLEWIEGRGGSVTVRELTKGMRQYRGKPDEARDVLTALVQAGYGRWEYAAKGMMGGRPTERFVLHSAPVPTVPVPETPRYDPGSVGIGDGDTVTPCEDDDWGTL